MGRAEESFLSREGRREGFARTSARWGPREHMRSHSWTSVWEILAEGMMFLFPG